jgi:hypothetical protein
MSLPVDLTRTLSWWAAGPSWCLPLRGGRAEVYLLGGAAWTSTATMDGDYGTSYLGTAYTPDWLYGKPQGGDSPQVAFFVLGTSWSGGHLRLWRFGFALDAGAELQLAGKGAELDDPATHFDGSKYLVRTRPVPMSGAALRLGFDCLGWSPKPRGSDHSKRGTR